jgi:hypothetical protein
LIEDSAARLFHRFHDSASADTMVSLLRSRHFEIHLALMAAHLGEGQVVDGGGLEAAIGEDLHAVDGSHTPDEGEEQTWAALVRGEPGAVLTRWTEKRWVHRTVEERTGRVQFQLTSGALQAVQYMRGLDRNATMATKSAVGMIAEQIGTIAASSNPDPVTRKAAIEQQINDLSKEWEALDSGEMPSVDHADLVHKAEALCSLVERMPGDIVRYGEEFQTATGALWAASTADAEEYGASLERILEQFEGIAQTPEGRAYAAFTLLIGRASMRERLEDDIDRILDQVEGLPAYARDALASFVPTMLDRSEEVEVKKRTAFRRFDRFVRSGEATRFRQVQARIGQVQEAARAAFGRTHGGRGIGQDFPIGGIEALSVGRLRLDDGAGQTPARVLDTSGEMTIDAREELGLEHVNTVKLRQAVKSALREGGGHATLRQVLDQCGPVRVGDVVMLWTWAGEHGIVRSSASTRAEVETIAGPRAMRLPQLVFNKPIPPLDKPGKAVSTIDPQLTILEGIAE